MPHLLSFTGCSGVGKTTLARTMVLRMPRAHFVERYTTRAKRANDVTGEYTYVSHDTFNAMREYGEFLWTAEHAGEHYGTRPSSIGGALEAPHAVGIMILVPDVIHKLRDHLASIGKLAFHVPVFIVSPGEEVLRARLTKRGDQPEDIHRRLAEAASWEESARKDTTPFHFIRNDSDLEIPLQELVALVSGS